MLLSPINCTKPSLVIPIPHPRPIPIPHPRPTDPDPAFAGAFLHFMHVKVGLSHARGNLPVGHPAQSC